MIVLIVVFAALATAGLTGAIGVLFGRREAAVERRLAGYDRTEDIAVHGPGSAPTTSAVQQAVEITNRLARRTGLLERVDAMIEQADLPIRAGELIFYTVALSVMIFLIVAILVSPLIGLLLGVVLGLVPFAFVARKQSSRKRKFEAQLPDALTLLASSLRAGFSFMQGLEAVAQEIGEPMRRELQRVFTEVRLGRAPEDALGDAAVRMDSRDLAWSVMAIKIQREVGGNLATLLDTVADTMQKRERVRREIRALTAEGRMSAVVLGLAPPAVGFGLFLLQPDYIKILFNHAIGLVAVIGATALAIVGYFWLRRLVDIEV